MKDGKMKLLSLNEFRKYKSILDEEGNQYQWDAPIGSIKRGEDSLNEKMKCWKGYERVPGTKAGTKGSCRKKKSKNKKKSR